MKTFTVLVLSRYLSGLPEQSHSLTLRLSSAWREHSGGFTQGPSTLHILSFFSRLGETSGAESCSNQSEKKKGGESEREGTREQARESECSCPFLILMQLFSSHNIRTTKCRCLTLQAPLPSGLFGGKNRIT